MVIWLLGLQGRTLLKITEAKEYYSQWKAREDVLITDGEKVDGMASRMIYVREEMGIGLGCCCMLCPPTRVCTPTLLGRRSSYVEKRMTKV